MALECKTLNLDLLGFIIHGIFPMAKVKNWWLVFRGMNSRADFGQPMPNS